MMLITPVLMVASLVMAILVGPLQVLHSKAAEETTLLETAESLEEATGELKRLLKTMIGPHQVHGTHLLDPTTATVFSFVPYSTYC